jgi:hypothetical protein
MSKSTKSPPRIVIFEKFLRHRFPGWRVDVDVHLGRLTFGESPDDSVTIDRHNVSFPLAEYDAWLRKEGYLEGLRIERQEG